MFFSDLPTTKEQALKTRYNEWAGNPKGTPYTPGRCAMEVHEAGRSCMCYQCHRKPGHGPAGLYCGQHAKEFRKRS
jgi:hypothetical protein